MKSWSSAIFPLAVLLTLTALTFWLRYATDLGSPRHDGKNRHDPDFIITDSTLRKLDGKGNLQYTLRSTEIRHFPDDDSTEFAKPLLVSQKVKKPTVTIGADRGISLRKGEQIDFYDNVQIVRAASAKDQAMTAQMNELTVFPDDEKAFTKSPVLITKGQSWLKGVGMQVDTRAETYVLESQAVASLESRFAKK
jgi:lipopolysaccharide export system protein LptC